MNKKIDCNIIVDLLPLYHDNVVSEETKIAIDEHLANCEKCKREYQLISEELPKVSPNSTKDKFSQMVKKQKLKRTLSIFISIILGCGVTIGGIHVLTKEPLRAVPSDEIEVLQAYVAETTNGQEVFVWYNAPAYSGNTKISSEVSNEGKLRYDIIQEVALLAEPQENFGINESVDSFSLENQYGEVEEIYFNDNLIWSLEENADDEIPTYANEFLNYGWSSRSIIHDYEQGVFGIGKGDEDMVYWDLDGNVISEKTIQFD